MKATAKQAEVVAVMRSYIEEHGMPPTVREIADAIGVASTNAVFDRLHGLKRKGLVRHEANKARAWRPA